MRAWLTLVALAAFAIAAGAQQSESASERPRRAPLAFDELEPAVEVGRRATEQAQSASPRESAAAPRASAPAPRAMEALALGATSITGNQELPKVLHIVPWKSSELGDLVGRPINTLLDEVLTPVDPEVFQRHLSYYESLHGVHEKE